MIGAMATQHPAILPIFRCLPERLSGIPVARENFCFACDIPTARFHENEIPKLGIRFFAIAGLRHLRTFRLTMSTTTPWIATSSPSLIGRSL